MTDPAFLEFDGTAPKNRMREVAFLLPFALESLNVRDRKHAMQKHHDLGQMKLEVIAALGGTRYLPLTPFPKARVTVVRRSAGQLDTDNAYASCKSLLDVLRRRTDRHPVGLSIIEDDSARCCELIVRQEIVGKGEGSTLVRIEEIAVDIVTIKAKRKPRTGRAGWKSHSRRGIKTSDMIGM